MASEGVLAYAGSDGARRLVKSRAQELPAGLEAWVEERMSSALSYQTETEDSEQNSATDPNVRSFEGTPWRLFVLIAEHEAVDTVVGALVLCNPAALVPLDVLRTLTNHLQGDPKRAFASEWSEQLGPTRQE